MWCMPSCLSNYTHKCITGFEYFMRLMCTVDGSESGGGMGCVASSSYCICNIYIYSYTYM